MNLLQQLLSPADQDFFTELTREVSFACRHSAMDEAMRAKTPNHLPFDPVKPGGLKSYPAVWIQDFTMIFAAGFLPNQCGLDHLRLILATQHGPEMRRLDSGAAIPPWAIADHINFDGSPVFFPGTYSAGSDQGGEPWGLRPPLNNYFDAIWLAWLVAGRSGSGRSLLTTEIGGSSVYQRLQRAFQAPPADQDGIVHTAAAERAVGFIFCDTIRMTGKLLMATLLRRRAARQMQDFAVLLDRPEDAAGYAREVAKADPGKMAATFAHPSGWLRAATGSSGEPDVFGTLYALYSGAIDGACRQHALAAVIAGLEHGQIEQDGALRHVPLNHSHRPESAWEQTLTPNHTYQNGAYWHMPAGWLAAVLLESRPDLARACWGRYLEHLRREDFRQGGETHAPWEWICGARRSVEVPLFGPSVTLPYAVLAQRC